MRVTSAVASRKRRKRLIKKAKGFWGDRKNHIRQTKDAIVQSMKFHFMHRKLRKREFRRIWISRINTAARIEGLSYSKFISGLEKAGVVINRQMLSELAIHDPKAFSSIANVAKKALV